MVCSFNIEFMSVLYVPSAHFILFHVLSFIFFFSAVSSERGKFFIITIFEMGSH